MERLAAQVNLVPCAPASTFLFMTLCDGGPPAMERLGAPDQDADIRAQLAIVLIVGDQSNILSLISTYDLNLTYLLYLVPIPSQINA